MARKIRVGILFGGRSAEHEVSLQSARNVLQALDPQKYEAVLIGIDKSGRWHLNEASSFLLNGDDPARIRLTRNGAEVTMVPWEDRKALVHLSGRHSVPPVDVIFPVLHGPMGEDGTVQGLLKLAGLPFVGSGVLGSAVAMDKDVAKRLLLQAGVPVARCRVFHQSSRSAIDYDTLIRELGRPLFVKPANLGSSVGIRKVARREELEPAVEEALTYDHKILIEEFIEGREIECSVLGNLDPEASVLGEVIPQHEFYSYEAKYLDENGALLKVPADLPAEVSDRVRQMAVQAFKVLGCEGMARVDFFVTETGNVFLNELNTIPGFTRISMYPRLWQASGLSYSQLLDRLIQLAQERFERDRQLKTSYEGL